MRVLLLYKKSDRPILEMVADHLARAGLDIVLDMHIRDGETIVDTARREIEFADRVVVSWTLDTDPAGTIRELASQAGRAAKLLLLQLDQAGDPLSDRVVRFSLGSWNGEQNAPEIDALMRALSEPLEAVETGAWELFQQSTGPDHTRYGEAHRGSSDRPLPSPTYAPSLEEPPISSRRQLPDERVTMKAALSTDEEEEIRATIRDDILFSVGRGVRAAAMKEDGQYPARPISPVDATAFAPKELRRGTPELVRLVFHKPSDAEAIQKAIKRADSRSAHPARRMGLGMISHAAEIGVSLEVLGARCTESVQRARWFGEPIEFSFGIEADPSVRQVVVVGRIFVNDAQIGSISFSRPVKGSTRSTPHQESKVRLKRHKRVFLSYASQDRETVGLIAVAYYHSGIRVFWDRASLEPGEEWPRRLRQELDRCDLFHLCWSKAAAASAWVEQEAMHAVDRRRRSIRRRPHITLQMLDGPPWAPHSPKLDSINFDDLTRAAIVGYARGEE